MDPTRTTIGVVEEAAAAEAVVVVVMEAMESDPAQLPLATTAIIVMKQDTRNHSASST